MSTEQQIFDQEYPELARGTFHTFVLYQSKYWIDIYGNNMLISNIAESHLQNIIPYLLRNAQRFMEHVEAEAFAFNDFQFTTEDPIAWMKSLPIYIALQNELGKRLFNDD